MISVSQLILDTLPRLKDVAPGFTIYGAANAITSLIYKTLLDHKSDLIATGTMETIMPAGVVQVTLPTDFSSFAERPGILRGTGLTDSLLAALVAQGLTEPHRMQIDSLLSGGASVASIQAIAVLDIPGINVQSIAYSLIDNPNSNYSPKLEPTFLDEDQEHDWLWWNDNVVTSGAYPWDYSSFTGYYKVVNKTVYIRPKLSTDIILSARYYQKPTPITVPADTLQYSELSYEVYREGVVMIMAKGLAVPEADPAFSALMQREILTEVFSRTRIMPERRTSRRDFI